MLYDYDFVSLPFLSPPPPHYQQQTPVSTSWEADLMQGQMSFNLFMWMRGRMRVFMVWKRGGCKPEWDLFVLIFHVAFWF